jgi:hypothetical protein
VPLPDPLDPDVTTIQGALLAAVHAHPAPAVTPIVALPPAAGTDDPSVESANEQPWPCVTVKGFPAIVTVADRAVPVVGATVTETEPGPVTLVPDPDMVIQSTLLDAVHVHPLVVVTATVPVPPSDPIWYVVGFSVYAHPCEPSDWVTLNWWPAIVMLPVRGGPVVAAISNVTAPVPVPLAEGRIVIQSESATAVHVHNALDARTSMRPDPPDGSKLAASCPSVMVHSPAACEISARWSFSTMAPRRTAGSGFDAASNWTAPSPWPLTPALMLSHGLSDDAVHAHSRAVVTAICPVPPDAGTGAAGEETDTPHLETVAGEVTVVLPDEPHAVRLTARTASETSTAARRCQHSRRARRR